MKLLGAVERLKELLGFGDPLEPQVWGVPLKLLVILDVLMVAGFLIAMVVKFA
jgi:hypothetical protein